MLWQPLKQFVAEIDNRFCILQSPLSLNWSSTDINKAELENIFNFNFEDIFRILIFQTRPDYGTYTQQFSKYKRLTFLYYLVKDMG